MPTSSRPPTEPPRHDERHAPQRECRGRCPHRPATPRPHPGALSGTGKRDKTITPPIQPGYGNNPPPRAGRCGHRPLRTNRNRPSFNRPVPRPTPKRTPSLHSACPHRPTKRADVGIGPYMQKRPRARPHPDAVIWSHDHNPPKRFPCGNLPISA